MTLAWSYPVLEVGDQPGRSEVVVTVHWRATLSDGEVSVGEAGSVSIPYDPETPFVAYADLTPEIVGTWVAGQLDTEAVLQRLTQRLAATAPAPPLIPRSPPWAA